MLPIKSHHTCLWNQMFSTQIRLFAEFWIYNLNPILGTWTFWRLNIMYMCQMIWKPLDALIRYQLINDDCLLFGSLWWSLIKTLAFFVVKTIKDLGYFWSDFFCLFLCYTLTIVPHRKSCSISILPSTGSRLLCSIVLPVATCHESGTMVSLDISITANLSVICGPIWAWAMWMYYCSQSNWIVTRR